MVSEEKKFVEFVEAIKTEKLSGFVDGEKSISVDYKLGFRLDHQGLNKDPSTKPHRLYVQPVQGGSSKSSKASSKIVLASVHCDDPEDDKKVRDGLIKSYEEGGENVVV